jgi:hypothetical protein
VEPFECAGLPECAGRDIDLELEPHPSARHGL